MAVRVRCLLDASVWMHEAARPLFGIHEGAGLGLAWRKVVRTQFAPGPASYRVFPSVVPFLPDSVERGTERVTGRLLADVPVPAGVVPRNACGKVEHVCMRSCACL